MKAGFKGGSESNLFEHQSRSRLSGRAFDKTQWWFRRILCSKDGVLATATNADGAAVTASEKPVQNRLFDNVDASQKSFASAGRQQCHASSTGPISSTG
jgi:hypothetical protein